MALARYEGVAQDAAGNVIPNATVEVRRDQPGRPIVALWKTRNGPDEVPPQPLGNPFTSDDLGQFGFHAPGGVYYIRVYTGPAQAPFQQYTRRYQAVGTAAERDVEELAAALESGTAPFPTLPELQAFVPTETEGVGGKVTTGVDAGFYHYDDSRDAGDKWVFDRPLYDSVARMTVTGGTANAIAASIDNNVDGSSVVLMILTPEETNTGPTTINGIDLLTFEGEALEEGWLQADVPVQVYEHADGTYRLTFDHRWFTLAAQTLAARDDTLAAKTDTEAARDLAQGYVAAAVSASNVPIFTTTLVAAGLTIPAGLSTVRTLGQAVVGDGFGADWTRVDEEPSHAGKFRSTDRFLPNGSTDADDGGWWKMASPEARGTGRLVGKGPAKLTAGARVILAVGDSTTDGAGTIPDYSEPTEYLKSMMRAARGYGGPGYIPFRGDTRLMTGWNKVGMTDIAIDDGVYGQYTLGGLGQYCLAGSGASMQFAPVGNYDRVRLFYLTLPGGGTFTIGGGFAGTISTDDTLGLAYLDLPRIEQGSIVFTAITGLVALCGGLFTLDNDSPVFANVATGGKKLQHWADQDQAMIEAAIEALNPAVIVNDLGMNDRSDRSAADHYADFTTIIETQQAAAPGADIVMVQGQEPSDFASSNFKDYVEQKKLVATEKGLIYEDLRQVTGNYAQAVANDIMLDGVHGNDKLQRLRAHRLGQLLGLATLAADPGIDDAGRLEHYKRGDLTEKHVTITAGVSTLIYTLVCDRAGHYAVEIEIASIRAGTTAIRVRRHIFRMGNAAGSTTGQAATVSAAPGVIEEFSEAAGDTFTVDYTLTAAIVSNRLEVSITASNYDASYNISGRFRLLRNVTVAGGKGVYEL